MTSTTPRFERTGTTETSDGESTVMKAAKAYETRETKPGFLTSEFISSIVATLAILIAAAMVDNFSADEAWPLVAFLSIGYMISRGLAKSGISRSRSDH